MEPTTLPVQTESTAASMTTHLHISNPVPARIIGLDQMGYISDMSAMAPVNAVPLMQVTGLLPHFIIPCHKSREHDPL